MTCIVGLEHDDGVTIGADSIAAGGANFSIRATPKVFKNGPMVMGYTTSFRMGQLLQHALAIPTPKQGQDTMEFLCTSFVDAVRKP